MLNDLRRLNRLNRFSTDLRLLFSSRYHRYLLKSIEIAIQAAVIGNIDFRNVNLLLSFSIRNGFDLCRLLLILAGILKDIGSNLVYGLHLLSFNRRNRLDFLLKFQLLDRADIFRWSLYILSDIYMRHLNRLNRGYRLLRFADWSLRFLICFICRFLVLGFVIELRALKIIEVFLSILFLILLIRILILILRVCILRLIWVLLGRLLIWTYIRLLIRILRIGVLWLIWILRLIRILRISVLRLVWILLIRVGLSRLLVWIPVRILIRVLLIWILIWILLIWILVWILILLLIRILIRVHLLQLLFLLHVWILEIHLRLLLNRLLRLSRLSIRILHLRLDRLNLRLCRLNLRLLLFLLNLLCLLQLFVNDLLRLLFNRLLRQFLSV